MIKRFYLRREIRANFLLEIWFQCFGKRILIKKVMKKFGICRATALNDYDLMKKRLPGLVGKDRYRLLCRSIAKIEEYRHSVKDLRFMAVIVDFKHRDDLLGLMNQLKVSGQIKKIQTPYQEKMATAFLEDYYFEKSKTN